jgi:8-oxo-dGTP diphosphatase
VEEGTAKKLKKAKDEHWLPESIFKSIIRYAPVVSADAIIVNDSKFLLTKRAIPPQKGRWHLPGGLLRRGERLADCARRIALDETGLSVEVGRIVGIYDDPSRNLARHDVTIAFLCSPVGGRLKRNWQASDLRYFSFNSLPPRIGFGHELEIADAQRLLRSNAHTPFSQSHR